MAKKNYYPDFNVGAYYGGRDDHANGQERADLLSLRVSMNVPLFVATKQSQAVSQRSHELMQQKYALQDEWNRTRAQISEAYNDFQRAKQQALLFKTGIIPQTRQTVPSMLAGADVTQRIAAPMLGGMLTVLMLSLLVFSVIYSLVLEFQEQRRLLRI